MALPALITAGGSMLAQTALGAGLTAGAVVLVPQLGSLLGGNVNYRLNDNSRSNDDRVIKIDPKGNKTYEPLNNENVKFLYKGGWEEVRSRAKEQQADAERKSALGELKGASDRRESREMLQLQSQLKSLQNSADLQRAELELSRTTAQNANTIAQGQLNNEGKRLEMEGKRATTLAEEAQANRFDNRITQNNQIEATLHQNAVAEANRAYEFDVNSYNQQEARRSAPGRTLMNLGAMLAGGRF